ncbi:MAG: ATP-dependent DNA helicase RecG [Actinomycetales bacterium]|nr:ATP-dependent DNA helicase RecG [Actinomycetales bacterium]
MVDLQSPLTEAIGAKTAQLLSTELGAQTVEDLLRHYPRRYEQRGALTDLNNLEIGEHVTVQAEVVAFKSLRNQSKPGNRQEVVISDGTGQLTLMFFNQHWREKELTPGTRGLFAGQVSIFNNKRQLTHPDYELLGDFATVSVDDYAAAFLPVYSATKKLPTWTIARCIESVLDKLSDVTDPLPEHIRSEKQLPSLISSLRAIHKPSSTEELESARLRLKWDEAIALQVVLAKQRYEEAQWPAIPRLPKPDGLLAAFDQSLPFKLTAGQQEVAETLATELAAGHPMHRLLQGEVGSGKTVLAVRAMLAVVDSGGQAALLAPTEVLAMQHYRAVTKLLGPLARGGELGAADGATTVTLLTGSLNTATRRKALLDITTGDAGIVIGTHALLEDRVDFFDLGLVVIDEQHRFGVEQRATLVSKAGSDRRPHTLIMTATPIPRTVAMTAFGALDVSTLTELPSGRQPISTHVVAAAEKPAHLERVWQRVCEEVAAGHQVYVVVPRIASQSDKEAESKSRPAVALEDLHAELTAGPLADLRVGALHGQMSAAEKDSVMSKFTAGPESPDGIDVLISTTVIEVGVDVPNATTMVIMDADRFGISQLHQLRGRVGRGTLPGLCLLVTEAGAYSPARARLAAVAATTDGFELAALDLEQRREGDVLGRNQSGVHSSLKLVSIISDGELLDQAKSYAEAIISEDPTLEQQPALANAISALVANRAEYVKKS